MAFMPFAFASSPPAASRLVGGGLAYALVLAAPFVYARHARSPLRGFRVFRSAYLAYVSFIFGMTYLSRIMGKVPGATLFALVLLLPFLYAAGASFGAKVTESKTPREMR